MQGAGRDSAGAQGTCRGVFLTSCSICCCLVSCLKRAFRNFSPLLGLVWIHHSYFCALILAKKTVNCFCCCRVLLQPTQKLCRKLKQRVRQQSSEWKRNKQPKKNSCRQQLLGCPLPLKQAVLIPHRSMPLPSPQAVVYTPHRLPQSYTSSWWKPRTS